MDIPQDILNEIIFFCDFKTKLFLKLTNKLFNLLVKNFIVYKKKRILTRRYLLNYIINYNVCCKSNIIRKIHFIEKYLYITFNNDYIIDLYPIIYIKPNNPYIIIQNIKITGICDYCHHDLISFNILCDNENDNFIKEIQINICSECDCLDMPISKYSYDGSLLTKDFINFKFKTWCRCT